VTRLAGEAAELRAAVHALEGTYGGSQMTQGGGGAGAGAGTQFGTQGGGARTIGAISADIEVGRCRLTLSNPR